VLAHPCQRTLEGKTLGWAALLRVLACTSVEGSSRKSKGQRCVAAMMRSSVDTAAWRHNPPFKSHAICSEPCTATPFLMIAPSRHVCVNFTALATHSVQPRNIVFCVWPRLATTLVSTVCVRGTSVVGGGRVWVVALASQFPLKAQRLRARSPWLCKCAGREPVSWGCGWVWVVTLSTYSLRRGQPVSTPWPLPVRLDTKFVVVQADVGGCDRALDA
jgi:hypothetical protein